MKKWNKRGFTLIELLVVVLIIGILAAVAVPQYQVAVEKARVAQMLPIMRHIYDALALYKLEHGRYYREEEVALGWAELGVEKPADAVYDGNTEMENDMWYCYPNEQSQGEVYCNSEQSYTIKMWQPDDADSVLAGKRACIVGAAGTVGERVCKALGKEIEDDDYSGYYFF